MDVEIGCQKRLRVEFTRGIADQEPADRHRRHPAAIPQRGSGGDLDEAVVLAVPETDAIARPGDRSILEDGGELSLTLSLDRRPTPSFALLRRAIEQVGVEAQAGNDAEMVADGGEEFDGCKCAVGDQDNIAVGKPAADLQGGLTSPIKQRLGRLRFAEIQGGGSAPQI